MLDPSYLPFALSVFFSQIAFNMLTVVLIFLVFYLIGASIFLCFPVFLLRWPGFQKESQAKDELPCGHFPDRIEYPLWKDD